MPRVGGCLLPGRVAQGPILGSRGAFAKKPRGGQDHVRKCSLVWTVREPHRHSWDAQLGRMCQRTNVRERRLAETSSLIRWFLHPVLYGATLLLIGTLRRVGLPLDTPTAHRSKRLPQWVSRWWLLGHLSE